MNNSLVSILIPCFNAEQWISYAIESALKQTYKNKEIIVVDDGSTDNSWKIINSYGSKIRTERTLNKGAGSARNYLMSLSNGEWLQYLDADDYLLPDKICNQIEELNKKTTADILYSPAIVEEHWKKDVIKEVLSIPAPHDPWILLARWRLPQTGSILWRKQAVIDVEGWKEDQPCCQEHELYLRLLKAGKQFSYTPEPGAVYRKWSDDTVCERDKLETYRQRLKITNEEERFLKDTGQLTVERQNEINQARFECARIIWNVDRSWANSLMDEVHNTGAPFVPRGRGVPLIYRYIYSCFGFAIAERIASLKRKISSCMALSR